MSNINPYNIDNTFPVAGQDNDSQGFRDNFTNTKNNFIFTKAEIEDLQLKGIFKGNLVGTTLDNDMAGAQIKNAQTIGFRETVNNLGSFSGSSPGVTINFSLGSYVTMAMTGSTTIDSFTNWAPAGTHAKLRLAVTVGNTAHTLTLPSAVSVGLDSIAGAVGTTITFSRTGLHIFEFTSSDGGATISIVDLLRNRTTMDGNLVPTIDSTFNIGSASSLIDNIYANNIVVSTLTTSGTSVSYTGNVTATNIIANAGVYGTVNTPIQSNITQVGTLTSLGVSGNITAGNVEVSGSSILDGGVTLSGIVSIPLSYATLANATGITLANVVSSVIVDPIGNIAVGTITMPTGPINGHRVTIGFANTVTSLTHTVDSGSGQTIKGALTTGSPSTFGTWAYHTPTNTWYRIG